MNPLLHDPEALNEHIVRVLFAENRRKPIFSRDVPDAEAPSSVLFLLADRSFDVAQSPREPCITLNKRSRQVKQPGDLCFPGGSVAPAMDARLAKLLSLPFFPVGRWPHWRNWLRCRPEDARRLALFFATSLRESFEEMRLNPFAVTFLGPLPHQSLVMFQRVIYPMVGWISGRRQFHPNREVEKIVSIPLRKVLNPCLYARYRIRFEPDFAEKYNRKTEEYPCFLHRTAEGTELLWGATYRIVMAFLELVFGFRPPDPTDLPVVDGVMEGSYLTGLRRSCPDSSTPWDRSGP